MSSQARAEVLAGALSKGDQTGVPGPTENVDRIREILFGTHMREYAQRFAEMEERFVRETSELKAEVRRRLDSLEAYTRQELGALTDRLNTERRERTESAVQFSREVADSIRSLERRGIQADEQVAKDLRELRQATLDIQKSLSAELTQSLSSAEVLQHKRLEELRESAVDRYALGNFLTEIALRLRGEFRVSGVGYSVDAGKDG